MTLGLLVALGACGGDDDGDGAGGESGGGGGAAGVSGSGAGAGGASGGVGGSISTAGTGGGGAAGTGGSGALTITCSDEAPTTAITCGDETCPLPMLLLGMDTCSRPCCFMDGSDEVCGTLNTNTTMPTECALPPEPDDRCPDYVDATMMMREGCCTADDTCGVVSTILGQCVTESPLVPSLPMTPPACDDAGADGGT